MQASLAWNAKPRPQNSPWLQRIIAQAYLTCNANLAQNVLGGLWPKRPRITHEYIWEFSWQSCRDKKYIRGSWCIRVTSGPAHIHSLSFEQLCQLACRSYE